MEKRIAFMGIVVQDRKKSSNAVNKVLSDFGEIVIARLGVPYPARKLSLITLVLDASTDQIGALSGKLGALPDVSVKTALAK